jgi:Protein of unknown function with PCYCGC motif
MSMRRPAGVLGTVAAVALAGVLAACSGSGHHPAPREGITGAGVLPASTWGDDMRLVRAYEAAHDMPAVFDGLYCYCQCKENMGHRSLLTCYRSEHAASCDICLTEGTMAARMHRQGATLRQIRDAIDAQFRS